MQSWLRWVEFCSLSTCTMHTPHYGCRLSPASGLLPNDPSRSNTIMVPACMLMFVFCVQVYQTPRGIRNLLSHCGVALGRVRRAGLEIERKTFHLCGLIVPMVYQCLLMWGFTRRFCNIFASSIVGIVWAGDTLRLCVPAVNAAFRKTPFGKMMRDEELNRMTGGAFRPGGGGWGFITLCFRECDKIIIEGDKNFMQRGVTEEQVIQSCVKLFGYESSFLCISLTKTKKRITKYARRTKPETNERLKTLRM